MRVNAQKIIAAALAASTILALSACGSSSSDTVDKSEITNMSEIGAMEGTTNDMSAIETPVDTNVAQTEAAADNAAENTTEASNAD
jgi:hypothetical protein